MYVSHRKGNWVSGGDRRGGRESGRMHRIGEVGRRMDKIVPRTNIDWAAESEWILLSARIAFILGDRDQTGISWVPILGWYGCAYYHFKWVPRCKLTRAIQQFRPVIIQSDWDWDVSLTDPVLRLQPLLHRGRVSELLLRPELLRRLHHALLLLAMGDARLQKGSRLGWVVKFSGKKRRGRKCFCFRLGWKTTLQNRFIIIKHRHSLSRHRRIIRNPQRTAPLHGSNSGGIAQAGCATHASGIILPGKIDYVIEAQWQKGAGWICSNEEDR